MKSLMVISILTLLYCPPDLSQVHKPSLLAKYGIYDVDNIKPEEYSGRRDSMLLKMEPGSVAIFRASDPCRRNNDQYYRYRQNSNFLYLTGYNESGSTLVLIKDGTAVNDKKNIRSILFVRERESSWRGDNLGIEGVKEVFAWSDTTGSVLVLPNDKLWDILPGVLQSSRVLYYSPSLPEIIFDPVSDKKFVTIREVNKGIEEKYPGLAVKVPGLLLSDMRTIKSAAELVLIQKAVDATVEGCREAIKKCEPGMYEYQLEAAIEYCFTNKGCESAAYTPIIGSGPNSLILHYDSNRRKMNSGELVLIDIGAEYHGYSGDVTRTIPVNGKYSPEQKEIYELVLRAQEIAIEGIKPGAKLSNATGPAVDFMGQQLVKLGIIREKSEIDKFCTHRITHFIGLDVHDAGKKDSLETGMVFTIEPGIYIPDSSKCDSKYWGIGIRIEDDVVVTEDGCNVLSDGVPSKVADIERLMKKPKKTSNK